MMKSYQVGSMILNVSMHAQQSLSLSLSLHRGATHGAGNKTEPPAEVAE